jgi:hypothetical protein
MIPKAAHLLPVNRNGLPPQAKQSVIFQSWMQDRTKGKRFANGSLSPFLIRDLFIAALFSPVPPCLAIKQPKSALLHLILRFVCSPFLRITEHLCSPSSFAMRFRGGLFFPTIRSGIGLPDTGPV